MTGREIGSNGKRPAPGGPVKRAGKWEFRVLGLGRRASCVRNASSIMKTQLALTSLAVLGLAASHLSANVLLTENFSYADGGLVAGSSSNWTLLSGSTTPLQVVGGVVTGMTHGSGSREDAARVFSATPITVGNVYVKFDLTVTTAPTAGQEYFMAVSGLADTNYRGRVFIAAPAVAAPGAFRLGISNSTSTVAFTSDLMVGSYDVVFAATSGTTGSALWVGADAVNFIEGTTSATAIDTTTAQSLARVALRQGTGITVANGVNVDNLIVATTFADVAGTPIPEPSAAAGLAGLAALAGVAMRRRRRA